MSASGNPSVCAPRLIVRCRPAGKAGTEALLALPSGRDRLVVGRGEAADWWFEDEELSREHFAFRAGENGWRVEHLSGKRSTRLDGVAIHGVVAVACGQRIEAGGCVFTLQADFSGSRLEVVAGEGPVGSVLALRPGRNRIGRDPVCEVLLDQPGLSRVHAELILIDGRWRLSDRSSLNGTYLNGDPVRRSMWIKHGDRILVGRTLLEFSDHRVGDLLGREVPVHAGPARLVGLAGNGSLGTVYRARLLAGGSDLAIKFLDPGLATDPAETSAWLAAAAPVPAHPLLVPQHRPVDMPGLPPAAVQDWMVLGSLHRLLANGPLSWPDCLALAQDIARGLQAAPRPHRGLRPGNVMFSTRAVALVADLRLCAPFDPAHAEEGAEARYISPEEAEGRPADGLANQFSLGLILYHACTGLPPFVGQTRAELAAVRILGSLPSTRSLVHDLPIGADHLIGRLLARDPRQRYPTWSAVIADLERLRSGQAIASIEPGESAMGHQHGSFRVPGGEDVGISRLVRRRNRIRVAAWAGTAIALGIALAAALLAGLRPGAPARPAEIPPATPGSTPLPADQARPDPAP